MGSRVAEIMRAIGVEWLKEIGSLSGEARWLTTRGFVEYKWQGSG
jgi:hypothetical protein